jgi:hypothetical protein
LDFQISILKQKKLNLKSQTTSGKQAVEHSNENTQNDEKAEKRVERTIVILVEHAIMFPPSFTI